jgi:hypothetical protein
VVALDDEVRDARPHKDSALQPDVPAPRPDAQERSAATARHAPASARIHPWAADPGCAMEFSETMLLLNVACAPPASSTAARAWPKKRLLLTMSSELKDGPTSTPTPRDESLARRSTMDVAPAPCT